MSAPIEKTSGTKIDTATEQQDDTKFAEGHDQDISAITTSLKVHVERISGNIIGREDILMQACYAILTREHLLLLGRTGMAKSFLASSLFSMFDNTSNFITQASKDQTPDNYFGPYNIEEFKNGKILHTTSGSIIEADLAFLDELFDASDIVLRSLLTVLNERKFINGPEKMDASIHTAIATANYMRTNEVTEAVLDRFIFKSIIPEDGNMYTRYLIDHSYARNHGEVCEPENKIQFHQVQYLSRIIRNIHPHIKVAIPDFIYFIKNVIIGKFVSAMRNYDSDYFVSPRKQAKMADFLRASALMDNRHETTLEDVEKLFIPLCTLNGFVSIKSQDKSERDIFADTYQQTMVHFTTSGAIHQIEYLLKLKNIFQEIRENPERKEQLKSKQGILKGVVKLFKKVFPMKSKKDDEITIETLKESIIELNPAAEEVRELKDGILKDYHDLKS